MMNAALTKLYNKFPFNSEFRIPNSFHGHAFRQVPWLVNIRSAQDRDVIGEELQRNGKQERQKYLILGRYGNSMVPPLRYLRVAFRDERDNYPAAGLHLFDI